MKRTLGRPTYAFEARQYVVSVCVMGVSELSTRCSRCVVGRKREWILNVCGCVWLVKATYNTCSSLIANNSLCDTFGLYEETCSSQLTRQNFLTKEASVCAWLGIDHMALTRVESGRMIGEDDDFIPHHMYQLEVSCCSSSRSWFRASPLSIHRGSIHKVSQAPEAVGDYGSEDALHLTQQSPLLAN